VYEIDDGDMIAQISLQLHIVVALVILSNNHGVSVRDTCARVWGGISHRCLDVCVSGVRVHRHMCEVLPGLLSARAYASVVYSDI
jgi:hypothetical protein